MRYKIEGNVEDEIYTLTNLVGNTKQLKVEYKGYTGSAGVLVGKLISPTVFMIEYCDPRSHLYRKIKLIPVP